MKNFNYDLKTKINYYQYLWLILVFCFLSFSLVIATIAVSVATNDFIAYAVLKGLASLAFLVIGIYSITKLKTAQRLKWKHFINLGFIFVSFVANVLMNINLIAGISTFLVAQCIYIWYCNYNYKFTSKKELWLLVSYIPIVILVNVLFGVGVLNRNPVYWTISNFYGIAITTSIVYAVITYHRNQNMISLLTIFTLLLLFTSSLLFMFKTFMTTSYINNEADKTLTFFTLLTYFLSMNMNSLNLKNINFNY